MAGSVVGETTDPLPAHSTCFYLVSRLEGAAVAVPQFRCECENDTRKKLLID
jgi:hypothetical protein